MNRACVWYCNKVLVIALKVVHILCAFGLLGESLPGLTAPFEEHDLQALQKMGLVRSQNFQPSLDLHPRRLRWI